MFSLLLSFLITAPDFVLGEWDSGTWPTPRKRAQVQMSVFSGVAGFWLAQLEAAVGFSIHFGSACVEPIVPCAVVCCECLWPPGP